jgi:hypothetical protein
MSKIDSPEDLAAAAPVAEASGADAARNESACDEQTLLRIEALPRDVGWMMIYVGVLGVALPGIIGTPCWRRADRSCCRAGRAANRTAFFMQA